MSETRDAAAPVGRAVIVEPSGGPARASERVASRRPWFGRMLEDAAIELGAFRPGGRVFAIASGGCTAIALARRGDRVTAVDVHPGQVERVRRRLAGDPLTESRMDRWLEQGRRRLVPRVWDPRDVDAFLRLVDVREQLHVWRGRLATPRFRALVRASVGRPQAAGQRAGFPFGWAPDRFGERLLDRLEVCLATHPNRWNPYVWWLIGGRVAPGTGSSMPIRRGRLRVEVGEACQWLESHPEARFDAFTLSNVLDGASTAQRERLRAAVRRAAEPGAVVVLRTLARPDDAVSAWNAARDRAGIWGGIDIVPVSRFLS